MARIRFSLRTVVFWLVPYLVISAAIWSIGPQQRNVPRSRQGFLGWGERTTLFAAITCSWLTTVGVVWVVRQGLQPERPPRPA